MNSELLATVLAMSKQQREAAERLLLQRCQKDWSEHGCIQGHELLAEIGWSSPEGYESILQHHPANRLLVQMENIATTFEILKRAKDEIISAYGNFHAQITHNVGNSDRHETLVNATGKVFTFSFAAAALIQAYRGLSSASPDLDTPIKELVREVFGSMPLADFIKDLRNNFGHSHLFRAQPSSTIQLGKNRTVTTQLEFDRKTLLDEGTCWSLASREFIGASEKLDVMAIVTTYFDLAERLFLRSQNLPVLRNGKRFTVPTLTCQAGILA